MNKRFEDLTKEQQRALKIAGRKFVTRMLFNGINTGWLLALSNLVLIMGNLMFFQSTVGLILVAAVVDVILINMMLTANRHTASDFKEQANKILDNK